MDKEEFASLYSELREEGYYFLNPEDVNGLYGMLQEGLRIRAAKENTIIPNIELKFIKDDFDRYSIDNKLEAFIDHFKEFVYGKDCSSSRNLKFDMVFLFDYFSGIIYGFSNHLFT